MKINMFRSISVVILFYLMSMSANAVKEPPHTVVLKDDKIELRQYEPTIVAEVTVTGNMRRAGNSGFRLLADYIFGNNQNKQNIEVTAPVKKTESTKIEMTAPVSRVENPDKSWVVTFVMPQEWTMETLPEPNNPEVKISERPGELIATIRFSGRGSEVAHKKQQIKLEAWLDQQGYRSIAAPRFAGYDAPWIPWPFRRNEVMVPVVKN